MYVYTYLGLVLLPCSNICNLSYCKLHQSFYFYIPCMVYDPATGSFYDGTITITSVLKLTWLTTPCDLSHFPRKSFRSELTGEVVQGSRLSLVEQSFQEEQQRHVPSHLVLHRLHGGIARIYWALHRPVIIPLLALLIAHTLISPSDNCYLVCTLPPYCGTMLSKIIQLAAKNPQNTSHQAELLGTLRSAGTQHTRAILINYLSAEAPATTIQLKYDYYGRRFLLVGLLAGDVGQINKWVDERSLCWLFGGEGTEETIR